VKSAEQRDEAETRVRATFEELRAHDQATAPPFASLWGRPAAARRSLLWWAVPLGAAAAAVLVVLAIGLDVAPPADRTAAPPAELVGVHDPEPLAFLLERPRGGPP
jgi:hypothetical protein